MYEGDDVIHVQAQRSCRGRCSLSPDACPQALQAQAISIGSAMLDPMAAFESESIDLQALDS